MAAVAEQEQPVAAEVAARPEAEPQPAAAAAEPKGWGAKCRAEHSMTWTPALAGSCDGCGRPVRQNEMVMDCRPCNFYLCRACCPVDTCPSGHTLRTSAAISGACAGCCSPLGRGELIMDCRECNWYVCSACHPLTQCPAGHSLKLWATQAPGHCDKCRAKVGATEFVMDCRHCDWYLCKTCHPQVLKVSEGTPVGIHAASALPLPQCPVGHSLKPYSAKPGKCDKCDRKVMSKEMVMDCRQCDYYLCSTCHPITQCPVGHALKPSTAASGTCDGCRKLVQKNQCVMDCRACNYYLCSSCHLPRGRATVVQAGGC